MLADAVAEEAAKHPDKKIDVIATDEDHWPETVARRMWPPNGERPLAPGPSLF
jgi:hypothetical protein